MSGVGPIEMARPKSQSTIPDYQCVKESFLDPIMLEESVPGAMVPAASSKDSLSIDEASIDVSKYFGFKCSS